MTDFEWIEAITAKAQAACHPRGRGRLTQLNDITNALPVIVAEVLAPIEAVVAEWREVLEDPDLQPLERSAIRAMSSELVRAIADIRKAVGA